MRQVERYAAQAVPAIARRFAAAALTAIETAIETPAAGQPHAAMPGLHTRPVKGFTDFTLFYLVPPTQPTVMPAHAGTHDLGRPGPSTSWVPASAGMTGGGATRPTILRVLHTKRDIESSP